MVQKRFLECIDGISFSENEPMAPHTTFKIGGRADVFVSVKNTNELCTVLRAAEESDVPRFVIGKGSNLLVSDSGIEGAVICLSGIDQIEVSGNHIVCGAGASLAAVCTAARDAGLSGLEFAYGIPGSIGGALYMNAGAYGGEMKDVVLSAECADGVGNAVTVEARDMALGYRTSAFKQNGLIITRITLALTPADKDAIADKMQELLGRRKDKQPLEYPSAGSTFKRPEGHFAGALIEKNSLKGVSVGGAQVSQKHAGFVINRGGATCADVKALIKKIQDTVYENDGVKLEPEVIFAGRCMNGE